MNLIDCDEKFAAETIFVIWSVTHRALECEYGAVFFGSATRCHDGSKHGVARLMGGVWMGDRPEGLFE